MIYSCFHAPSGLYRYFRDDTQIPLNADLPVPKLPPLGNKIGVPAIDAGRPLPANAKPIGEGWRARGMIVKCDGGAVSGFSGVDDATSLLTATVAAAFLVGVGWFLAGSRDSGRGFSQ